MRALGAGATATRLAAVKTLGGFADPDVRSLLDHLAGGVEPCQAGEARAVEPLLGVADLLVEIE